MNPLAVIVGWPMRILAAELFTLYLPNRAENHRSAKETK